MMKRRAIAALLAVLCALCAAAPSAAAEACGVRTTTVTFGFSELGRPMGCTILEPESYDRTILVLFAIHGFEDKYDRDGQALVDTAQQLIASAQQEGWLHRSRLLVVPCANPDGLAEGRSNHRFGRCNASGVDLHRDFDAAHKAMPEGRYYTPFPFSAPESRAIRDLVWEWKPDIVLDCHGWLGCTIGDAELARVFKEEMRLAYDRPFSDTCHGYFSYWAHQQGAQALLVEFSRPSFDREPFLRAMERLMAGEYERPSSQE